jgi:hypothetical protein
MSPYSLLFGCNPRLPTDENDPRPISLEGDWDSVLRRIETLQHARMQANRQLIERAVAAQKVRAQLVKETPFVAGQWVLVRAEARNKFEGRWFGPYRIAKAMPLGTYRLADPDGKEVKTLINGQRLILARVQQPVETIWNSSKIQGQLRKREIQIERPSAEVEELFGQEADDTPTYDELATLPTTPTQQQDRSGERSVQVGEEERDDSNKENIDPSLLADANEEGMDTVELSWDGFMVGESQSPNFITDTPSPPPASEPPTPPETPPPPPQQVDTAEDDTTRPDPDAMQGIEKPKRTAWWKRELAASGADHPRDTSRYGLRQSPIKKNRWQE